MTDLRSPMFGAPIGPWHEHFAWWPVRSYDHRVIWMRKCWRRCIQMHEYLSHPGPHHWFQHSVEEPPFEGKAS